MSTGEQAAVVLLAVTSVSAAWLMHRSGAGRVTSLAAGAFGGLLLIDLVLRSAGMSGAGLIPVAGLLAAPVALVGYPRVGTGLRGRVSTSCLVVLAVAGGAAVAQPRWLSGVSTVLALVLAGWAWWSAENAERDDRAALLWVLASGGFVAISCVLFAFAAEAAGGPASDRIVDVFVPTMCALIPVAMVVGVLRPEVVDVRWVLTTVAVTLTVVVCFIAAASTVVYGFEMFGGQPLTSATVIGVCALLALAVAPARRWLGDAFEQMLFGGRPDPIDALATVAGTMGDDLGDVLDAVRVALVLPYLRLEADAVVTESGQATPHVTAVALSVGEGHDGRLVVGHRPGELDWSRADRAVLDLVAPLLALTVRSRLLTDDVAASRREAVVAIEEERRRLRRDLHDGLGPTLTGIAFSAEAARNLVPHDPAAAAELLGRLRADTADAIVEVRRLVEGLRPPALDELGLVGALRSWAHGLHAAGGRAVLVDFSGEDAVTDLSAAGEVTAYRIVVEALTNVARHCGGSCASVRFSRARGHLVLDVLDGEDTGRWTAGAGLTAMRERAEAVGGRVEAGHGRVHAVIPLTR